MSLEAIFRYFHPGTDQWDASDLWRFSRKLFLLKQNLAMNISFIDAFFRVTGLKKPRLNERKAKAKANRGLRTRACGSNIEGCGLARQPTAKPRRFIDSALAGVIRIFEWDIRYLIRAGNEGALPKFFLISPWNRRNLFAQNAWRSSRSRGGLSAEVEVAGLNWRPFKPSADLIS